MSAVADNASSGRLAGVDYGTVRIGIAVTDSRQTLASPLDNYTRRTPQLDADYFAKLAQAEGIAAFVADAATVGADWFLGNAIGYIKLQVRPADAERAIELLREIPEPAVRREARDAVSDDECLACGAAMEQAKACPKCGWSFSDTGFDQTEAE